MPQYSHCILYKPPFFNYYTACISVTHKLLDGKGHAFYSLPPKDQEDSPWILNKSLLKEVMRGREQGRKEREDRGNGREQVG